MPDQLCSAERGGADCRRSERLVGDRASRFFFSCDQNRTKVNHTQPVESVFAASFKEDRMSYELLVFVEIVVPNSLPTLRFFLSTKKIPGSVYVHKYKTLRSFFRPIFCGHTSASQASPFNFFKNRYKK